MREGVTAASEAGRQTSESREAVSASSDAYPHGIRLPEARSSRQPSGGARQDGVSAQDREGSKSTSGNPDVLHGSVFILTASSRLVFLPALTYYR